MSHSSDKDSRPLLYVLTGDPKPLARCRISSKTGGRRCYDSQKEIKLIASISLTSQHNGRPEYQGPLRMDIVYYFHIAKTRVNEIKENDYMYYRPDVDNLEKMTLDLCVDAGLFHDDSLVSEVFKKKVYSNNPRTEFTIRELNG